MPFEFLSGFLCQGQFFTLLLVILLNFDEVLFVLYEFIDHVLGRIQVLVQFLIRLFKRLDLRTVLVMFVI